MVALIYEVDGHTAWVPYCTGGKKVKFRGERKNLISMKVVLLFIFCLDMISCYLYLKESYSYISFRKSQSIIFLPPYILSHLSLIDKNNR